MSKEIIRVGNSSYAKYEEVLIRKDEMKKKAFQYERAYVKEFGDLILEVFRMKLESIRKKKTIEYCQIFANRGRRVDQKALQAYLERELAAYKAQLESMIKDNEAAKNGTRVTESDMLKIKRIYHHLVKKIHPDINPVTNENEELKGLWQRKAEKRKSEAGIILCHYPHRFESERIAAETGERALILDKYLKKS